ncbi:Hypothetical protein SMAX5B_007235 [Scophthalmus maximus]|uniref:Uncharacterized protein n=1 Tax=Scophthalmus maximus TaxID=52904 RepID=A0A2U9CNQ7_SCOMX|nr:Hypothetical protein SMAX5B_007235 [Scophthalmus maximus]
MWKFADLVFQLQGGTFSGEQQEDSGRRHVTPSQPLSDVKLQFQVVAAEPKLESQSLLNKMKTNERREDLLNVNHNFRETRPTKRTRVKFVMNVARPSEME